ncbi:MAG: ribonuclease P protein component [bacterium]|nr:ribonuclease P protein component [bacterium]
MFPRENRLTEKSDFAKVLKEGRIFGGVLLSLAVYKGEGSFPKIGFIVSNKISKKAVERNRLKRLIRQGIRLHLSDIKDGMYLVFLAKKTAAGAASEEIIRESQALLKRSGVFKND